MADDYSELLEFPSASEDEGAIEEDTFLVSADASDLESLCKDSIDGLGAVAIPEVCIAPFPRFYHLVFSLLVTALQGARGFPKFGIGFPRGHGKTVWLKIVILYIILFTNRRFILVVCATEELAINLIEDVVSMLSSPNVVRIFGNWAEQCSENNKVKKKFYFRGRTIILKPIGSSSAIRGANIDNRRPDVMIFDDMQTRECAKSAVQAKDLQDWLIGTVMKAKDPTRCVYIYVGNMYPGVKLDETKNTGTAKDMTSCILENIKNNPEWMTLIVGAILEDGTALWEDVRSLESLLEEYESDRSMGSEDIFFAEVLNDPRGGNLKLFDESKVPELGIDINTSIPSGKFVVIDPSLNKKRSDRMPVCYCEVHDGIVVVTEIELGRKTPREMIRHVILRCVNEGYYCVVSEAQAMQELYLELFKEVMDSLHITEIVTCGITTGGVSKNTRISLGAKAVLNGEIHLAPNPYALYCSEMRNYNPLKDKNLDDIIDVTYYASIIPIKFPSEIIARDYMKMLLEGEGYGQATDDSSASFDTGFDFS